jgi:hypothetical protein
MSLLARIGSLSLLAAVGWCWAVAIGSAEELPVSIAYREQVTTFFGEAKAKFTFEIAAKEETSGLAAWLLLAKGRVLASGESAITLAPERPAMLTIERQLPPLNEGVAFPLQLRVHFRAADSKQPAAELELELWLVSENPFLDRQQALESLPIHLFDPPGDTAAALEKLSVPFKRAYNADALPDLEKGVLLIGEGVSLKDYRSLPACFAKLASRGISVICLAPADGEIPLPVQTNEDQRQATQFVLLRLDVVAEFDKRLKSPCWVAGESIDLCAFRLSVSGEQTAAGVVEAGAGWPWAEVHYSDPSARMVLCGCGIIRSWDQSPVPRYLVANLLETMVADSKKLPGSIR